jgi:hypothetical protein
MGTYEQKGHKTLTRQVAEGIARLIERAPAGGIFGEESVSDTVDSHGYIYGPVRFAVEVEGRIFEVSVQDVSGR